MCPVVGKTISSVRIAAQVIGYDAHVRKQRLYQLFPLCQIESNFQRVVNKKIIKKSLTFSVFLHCIFNKTQNCPHIMEKW